MRHAVIGLAALLTVAACGAMEQQSASTCFPADQQDLIGAGEYSGQQLVCSIDRIEPGARDKYLDRYPALRDQEAAAQ